MTNNSEQQLFNIYEKIELFLFDLIKTVEPANEDQINNYKSLRIEYSEFIEYFQPEYHKEKKLLELLSRYMKFARFGLNIYKEEDLDNFSKLIFTRILGIEFANNKVKNGFVELKTYLWANEVKHLQIITDTNSIDEKIIKDTLTTYFPNEQLIYTNNPVVDATICDVLIKRNKVLRCIFFEDLKDPNQIKEQISNLSKGEMLRKNWKKVFKKCVNVFRNLLNEIKNSPSNVTDEQSNTTQITETDFEDDSIPNNQRQLNAKQYKKESELEHININVSTQEVSSSSSLPSPPSSSPPPPSSSPPPPSSSTSKRKVSSNRKASSKRKALEAELSDEERSELRDPTYREQAADSEESDDQQESTNIVREGRVKPKPGTLRIKKRWTDAEIKALEDGLVEKGLPNWTVIKGLYPDVLADREPLDLRDKARNMIKSLRKANKDLGVYKIVTKHIKY